MEEASQAIQSEADYPDEGRLLLEQTIPQLAQLSVGALIENHFDQTPDDQAELVAAYRAQLEAFLIQELVSEAKQLMSQGVGMTPNAIGISMQGFRQGVAALAGINNEDRPGNQEIQTLLHEAESLDDLGKRFFLHGLLFANAGPKATDLPRLMTTKSTPNQTIPSLAEQVFPQGKAGGTEATLLAFGKRIANVAETFAGQSSQQSQLIGWTKADGSAGVLQTSFKLL